MKCYFTIATLVFNGSGTYMHTVILFDFEFVMYNITVTPMSNNSGMLYTCIIAIW